MLVTESRSGRRLVGRLDRGMNLFDAILDVCRDRRVRTAELRALGALEAVEVAEYDQVLKTWKAARTFSGGMEILNLTGNVSERNGQLTVHAHGSVMRERDNGVEILGGHIIAARVFALEFVIDAFDDIILRRGTDSATGLTQWTEALAVGAVEAGAPAAMPTPNVPSAASIPSSVAASWSDVAAASAKREPKVDDSHDVDDGTLEPGDILIHPTFGRCEVQRIEGSYEFAHVRIKNGRLVRLSLEILKVAPAGNEAGHRVFRARID